MPALFLLDVATDNGARRATLHLSDGHGIRRAALGGFLVGRASPPSGK